MLMQFCFNQLQIQYFKEEEKRETEKQREAA